MMTVTGLLSKYSFVLLYSSNVQSVWFLFCQDLHTAAFVTAYFCYVTHDNNADLDPVVQSIVSITISLRHKFVKQISAKVTNTLLFLLKKYENPLHCKGFSHFFQQKITVFVILMFEILTKR